MMMKCMVCGEKFDESVKKCPVCGVGPENFVPVEEQKSEFKADTDEHFVLLGGGPGSHYAAAAIRERNATAKITIVTDEKELPYNRPMLTKALLADFSDNQFAIEGPEWYADNNVEVALGSRVVSIDVENKKVICENTEIGYDKLIYALGARCFVPPIKGADQAHVVSIRNIADAEKTKAVLAERKVEKAVVIGGGVMGLEAAWELKLGGYDVTVLEGAPGLLPKQLDNEASMLVEQICNKEGVNIVTGAGVAEITEDAVLLSDGRKFEAGLVIVSTGMRPNVAIAQEAGIKVDRLVVVDSNMKTNIEGVYACGDCTEFNGQQQAFWAQAVETGKVAGACAAGDSVEFQALGSSLVINAMNTSIFALGENGKDPEKVYRSIEVKDVKNGKYEKYYFVNFRLAGVILIGDTSKMVEMTKGIAEGMTYGYFINNVF